MQDFTELKQHLTSHADAHPIFNTSGPINANGLYKSFRKDICNLPRPEALVAITAIQSVRPSPLIPSHTVGISKTVILTYVITAHQSYALPVH